MPFKFTDWSLLFYPYFTSTSEPIFKVHYNVPYKLKKKYKKKKHVPDNHPKHWHSSIFHPLHFANYISTAQLSEDREGSRWHCQYARQKSSWKENISHQGNPMREENQELLNFVATTKTQFNCMYKMPCASNLLCSHCMPSMCIPSVKKKDGLDTNLASKIWEEKNACSK